MSKSMDSFVLAYIFVSLVTFFGISFVVKKILLYIGKTENMARKTGHLIGGVLFGVAISLMLKFPVIYSVVIGIFMAGGVIFREWWSKALKFSIDAIKGKPDLIYYYSL